jgi:tetratricopeptide (TPR) repeat protein
MARVNLRAAFMSGAGSAVTAQQVFTDRRDEVAAFELSLQELERSLDQGVVSPVVDRAQGRRNVLVYYGVGGIGKSTLSHELERRFLAAAQTESRDDVVCVRFDLSEDGACDVENMLLRLRAALGSLGNRWPAFDLALASYWARAHPGEPLQEFLDASSALRRVSRSVGLGGQIVGSVAQVVPGGVGALAGLAHRAALSTYRAIRDRVREGRLLSECDLFAEMIEANADYETLSFFPYLLAWDLEHQPRSAHRPKVCVFLDTFEVLGDRADRTAENFLQRCVYLMPNVLFVITGRNRIDWADVGAGGELDFTGRECWPNLHFGNDSTEPRQHLVGYLSDSDAESYLREVLTQDGNPAMSAPIREQIISGGQGLPLYLDLSVSHFVALLRRGVVPAVSDFGGSFTAVATRSIRDLPREERDLVRTAALVDRVDADLLRSGQPSLSHGCVARFLRRPFLIHDDAYERPYALHSALRLAIGQADHELSDGWSQRDRSDVAARLLRRLGGQVTASTGRTHTAQALESGLKLSAAYGVFDDWMVRATQRLVQAGQWMQIGTEFSTTSAGSPDFHRVRVAIQGVQLRRSGRAGEAVRLLSDIGADSGSGSMAWQLVRLHLAHALRNKGDYTAAAAIYQDLLGGEFHDVARYWLCDYDYLNGRFATAVTTLQSYTGSTPADEGERLRLLGHVWRVTARFDEARSTYEQAVALAHDRGLAAAEAKALANVTQTACWAGDTTTVSVAAARARELLDLVPNPVELVKIRSAEAIAFVQTGDTAAAREAVQDSRRLSDAIGYRGGHNLADVAGILLDVRTGGHDRARNLRRDLDARTRASGGNTYWVPIVTAWIDGADTAAQYSPPVEWVDGATASLNRWAHVCNL